MCRDTATTAVAWPHASGPRRWSPATTISSRARSTTAHGGMSRSASTPNGRRTGRGSRACARTRRPCGDGLRRRDVGGPRRRPAGVVGRDPRRRGHRGAVVSSGRAPRTDHEAVLGRSTADRLHKTVGDDIVVSSSLGRRRRLHVVGIAVVSDPIANDAKPDRGVIVRYPVATYLTRANVPQSIVITVDPRHRERAYASTLAELLRLDPRRRPPDRRPQRRPAPGVALAARGSSSRRPRPRRDPPARPARRSSPGTVRPSPSSGRSGSRVASGVASPPWRAPG